MDKIRLNKREIPLYVQLEQILKSQIMTGELLPEKRIPTEKELAAIYHVSSITARQAIMRLVHEGLLLRKQGKGTFVRKGLKNTKNIMTFNVAGDIKDVVPEGLISQQVTVLGIETVNSSWLVADALEMADQGDVRLITRTRADNNLVISYIKNYLPVDIGGKITKADLIAKPMLHVLKNKLKLSLKKGIQYVVAITADYEIASALSISISSPVLYLETIIYDTNDRPVDFVQTFYRSDLFRYTLKIDMKEIMSA
jgi:GntR family transcriptional regulator